MDERKSTPFALKRIDSETGDTRTVSEHATLREGWRAGQDAAHMNGVDAYALYRNGHRVARFAFSRLERNSLARGLEGLVL